MEGQRWPPASVLCPPLCLRFCSARSNPCQASVLRHPADGAGAGVWRAWHSGSCGGHWGRQVLGSSSPASISQPPVSTLNSAAAPTWFEHVSMLVIMLNCVTLGMFRPCEDVECRSERCSILEVGAWVGGGWAVPLAMNDP